MATIFCHPRNPTSVYVEHPPGSNFGVSMPVVQRPTQQQPRRVHAQQALPLLQRLRTVAQQLVLRRHQQHHHLRPVRQGRGIIAGGDSTADHFRPATP